MAPVDVAIKSDVMSVLELEDVSMLGKVEIMRVKELLDKIGS